MKEYYSTVEAAELCDVTRFSIINWTKKGILKAHKTPGGHRRIYHKDLHAFIKTYGLGLDLIKDKESINKSDYLKCWEFHRSINRKLTHKCDKCVVFLSGAQKCYTLRKELDHQKVFCKTTCGSCEYYNISHNTICMELTTNDQK